MIIIIIITQQDPKIISGSQMEQTTSWVQDTKTISPQGSEVA